MSNMPTQPRPSQPYTFDRIVRIGLGVAAAVVVVWLLRFLSDVLIPFAVAVLMAYLINPIVTVSGIMHSKPHKEERYRSVIIRNTIKKLPRKACSMPVTILSCQITLI